MNISHDIEIFASRITHGIEKLDLSIDRAAVDSMIGHAKELMEWNQRINLTAIKDPLDMAEKHFLDALGAGQFIKDEDYFVDLGPGAGFPSIPLKIQNPHLNFCLVEAVQKKTNFLKHVIRKLDLKKIQALHTRIENFDQTGLPRPQAIITRGVAHLETLIPLVAPLIFPEGTLYALKGHKVKEEMSPKLKKQYHFHIDKYLLPFSQSVRYLVRVQKI